MATPAIINVMSRAAEAAVRSLLRDFNEVENLQVSAKSPASFVSAARRRAEKKIHEELSTLKPDFGYLMPENGDIEGKVNSRFIVDPLNGVMNFIHGVPHWCITIALEENDKITAGIVFDPVKDEMFYAVTGQGSWMRGNKRLRVSGRKDLNACLISSNQLSVSTDPKHRSLLKQVSGYRNTGGMALDLAYVAAGRFDAYLEGITETKSIKPWDFAAGQLIVKEAGGYATQIDGRSDPAYNQNILAGNEHIYNQIKVILNKKK